MKTILFVHNDYAMPSGEEHSARALADLLKLRGHNVLWFLRSSTEIVGSPVGQIKAFFSGIHNPFAARTLARKLDAIRPDIVQVQNIYPLLSPAIFKPIRERRIPIVMRCPNYRLFCPNGLHLVRGEVCEKCLGFGREVACIFKNCENNFFKSTGYALRNGWARINGSILRSVDVFIVQTAFQRQRFAERGIPESRIGVVPALVRHNGCTGSKQCGHLVTFVGRVSPEKGIEDFLAAARQLPSIPFAVAGSENGMSRLRGRSPANVTWYGFLESDALHELYLRSRIVVVPSRWYEGFPNVIVQAMACARPVVATRLGAMASIVDDNETGVLFDLGDSRDLSQKLSALYHNRELCRRLGEAGRKKALAQYAPDSIYTALMAVYEKALRGSQQNRCLNSASTGQLESTDKSLWMKCER